MADIARVRCTWSGTGIIGPGVSTFHIQGDQGALLAAGLNNFWQSLMGNLPATTNVTIPAGGEVIDDVTGDLTGVWSGGPGTNKVGTDPGAFAQGCGGRIVWETGGVTGGRRVRGSTFVVPVGAGAYAPDGTLNEVVRGIWDTASDLLLTGNPTMVIWSKPFEHPTDPSQNRVGKSSVIEATTIPDKVSTLRSRRT